MPGNYYWRARPNGTSGEEWFDGLYNEIVRIFLVLRRAMRYSVQSREVKQYDRDLYSLLVFELVDRTSQSDQLLFLYLAKFFFFFYFIYSSVVAGVRKPLILFRSHTRSATWVRRMVRATIKGGGWRNTEVKASQQSSPCWMRCLLN